MGLGGSLTASVKRDPSVLIALLVLSATLAVPDYASSTSVVVSDPGGFDFALCGVLILGLGVSAALSSVSRVRAEGLMRIARALGLVMGLGFIAFELWCLFRRDAIDWWNYFSTTVWLGHAQHAARLSTVLVIAFSYSGRVSHGGFSSPRNLVFSSLLLMAGGGLFAATITGWTSKAYDFGAYDLASTLVSAFAFVCYLMVFAPMLNGESLSFAWVLYASFFCGSLMGSAVLRTFDKLSDSLLILGLPGVIVCLCGTVALLYVSLARLYGDSSGELVGASPVPAGSVDEDMLDDSGSEGVLKSALGRLEGYGDLSDRELEVILFDLSGQTIQETSDALSIAPSTIGTYRSRAYRKLGVSDRQGLLEKLLSRSEDAPCKPVPDTARLRVPSYAARLFVVPVGIVCVTFAVSRVAPRSALLFVSVFVFVAICFVSLLNLFGRSMNWRTLGMDQLPALFSSAAIVGGLLVLCLSNDWSARVACGVSAILAWFALSQERQIGDVWLPVCAIAAAVFGLVIATISDAVDPGDTILPVCVFALMVAALLTQEIIRRRERVILADFSLRGRDRARAYLMGRGLSELEANVALLTALGFSARLIAPCLGVASHTASQYRSRAYARLNISGKEELRELLRREANFR